MDLGHDLDAAQTELSQLNGLVVGLGGCCLCQRLLSGVIKMEKVFYPTKYGLQSRFKLAKNTPAPIVTWVEAQPRAVYGIERKVDGLEIVVSKQGRRKLIPWCWITGLRQAGYNYGLPL